MAGLVKAGGWLLHTSHGTTTAPAADPHGPKITVAFSNGNPIPALVTQVLVAPTSAGSSVTITGFGPVANAFRYVDLAG